MGEVLKAEPKDFDLKALASHETKATRARSS
jgi:hypothetical protein